MTFDDYLQYMLSLDGWDQDVVRPTAEAIERARATVGTDAEVTLTTLGDGDIIVYAETPAYETVTLSIPAADDAPGCLYYQRRDGTDGTDPATPEAWRRRLSE